ncbi:MAG: phage holin family protein [Balneolaceae bacterium]
MSDDESHNRPGFTGITREARRYIEKRLELFALSIGEQVTRIAADGIQRVIGILLVGGGLFFALFALGYYLGDLLDNTALGFLGVSVPLLLIGFIFMKVKPNSITRAIQSGILKDYIQALDENLEPLKTNGRDRKVKKKEEQENE